MTLFDVDGAIIADGSHDKNRKSRHRCHLFGWCGLFSHTENIFISSSFTCCSSLFWIVLDIALERYYRTFFWISVHLERVYAVYLRSRGARRRCAFFILTNLSIGISIRLLSLFPIHAGSKFQSNALDILSDTKSIHLSWLAWFLTQCLAIVSPSPAHSTWMKNVFVYHGFHND